jgi:chemotaxis protein CheD
MPVLADPSAQGVYLPPGGLHVSAENQIVSTILGSCVSVCLWDPVRGVGGMNHFLLPECPRGLDDSPRFGNIAISRLLDRLARLGSGPQELQALIYGGSCVIDAFRKDDHLGLRNVQVARKQLAQAGIRVLDEDVGGTVARRVQFHVQTGATRVRLVGGQ